MSKYFYEFTPVQRTVDGKPRAEIELKCAGEEGPGWKELLAARQKNPAEIRWGRSADRSGNPGVSRAGTAGDRAQQDPQAGGAAHVTAVQFLEGGVNNVTPKLGLGEGEPVFNEKLYRELKGNSSGPTLPLPIRVGCGIFGSWYGYSGGGAEVDQIWVEKASGRVLREEGFYQGEPRFVSPTAPSRKPPTTARSPARSRATVLQAVSQDLSLGVPDGVPASGRKNLAPEGIARIAGPAAERGDRRRQRRQSIGSQRREGAGPAFRRGPGPRPQCSAFACEAPWGKSWSRRSSPARCGQGGSSARGRDSLYNGVAVTDLPKLCGAGARWQGRRHGERRSAP